MDNNTNANADQTTQQPQQQPPTLVIAGAKIARSKWFSLGALVGVAAGIGGVLGYQAYRATEGDVTE